MSVYRLPVDERMHEEEEDVMVDAIVARLALCVPPILECIIDSQRENPRRWFIAQDPEILATQWGLNRVVLLLCIVPWLQSSSDSDSDTLNWWQLARSDCFRYVSPLQNHMALFNRVIQNTVIISDY